MSFSRKKSIVFIAVITFVMMAVLSVQVFAQTNTYNIDEMNISIEVPAELKILTRNPEQNVAEIPDEVGGDQTIREMEKAGIYLKMYPSDYSYIFDVSMLKNENSRKTQDFRMLDDEQLEQIRQQLLSEENVVKCTVMMNQRATFLTVEMEKIQQNGIDVYTMLSYTVLGGEQITITLQSYDEAISTQLKSMLSEMASSIEYDEKTADVQIPLSNMLWICLAVFFVGCVFSVVIILILGKRSERHTLSEDELLESVVIRDFFRFPQFRKKGETESLFYKELENQGLFNNKKEEIVKPEEVPKEERETQKKVPEKRRESTPSEDKIVSIDKLQPEAKNNPQKQVIDLMITKPGVVPEDSIELSRMESEEIEIDDVDDYYKHKGIIRPAWEEDFKPRQDKLLITEDGDLMLDKNWERILEERQIREELRRQEEENNDSWYSEETLERHIRERKLRRANEGVGFEQPEQIYAEEDVKIYEKPEEEVDYDYYDDGDIKIHKKPISNQNSLQTKLGGTPQKNSQNDFFDTDAAESVEDLTEEIENLPYMKKEIEAKAQRQRYRKPLPEEKRDEISLEFDEDDYWNRYK